MSFTNHITVRTHLVAPQLPESTFENVPVTLNGENSSELPHANLIDGTVTVKWIADESPVHQSGVLLSNYNETVLDHDLIMSGSLVAAADESSQTVFTEEKDFRVDTVSGTISRVPGTAIPNASAVVVWYDYFTPFTDGDDYRLDFENGYLSRTSGSAIPDGATVFIDYTVAEGSAENLLIDEAIVEAEDFIVRCLREGYTSFSLDQGLKSGATYLTLAIVARGMAALTLSKFRGADAHSRSKEWQSLADQWWKLAWDVLAPFTLPHSIRTTLAQ